MAVQWLADGAQWRRWLEMHTLRRDVAGGRHASGLDGAGGQAGGAEGSSDGNHGDGCGCGSGDGLGME